MQIQISEINKILQQEDIEGYITLGAPKDEYESEAKHIVSALAELRSEEINQENIAAIIALIWRQNFNLSDADMDRRLEAILKVVSNIMSLKATKK